jgi:hypothetical protein
MKIDLNKIIEKVIELKKENKKLKQENELYKKIYVKESKDMEYDSNGDKTIKQYFEDKD